MSGMVLLLGLLLFDLLSKLFISSFFLMSSCLGVDVSPPGFSIPKTSVLTYYSQQVQHLYSAVVEQTLGYAPPPCELQKIVNETIAFCDPLDGKTDGVVSRTDLCKLKFNINSTIGLPYYCPKTGAPTGPPGLLKRQSHQWLQNPPKQYRFRSSNSSSKQDHRWSQGLPRQTSISLLPSCCLLRRCGNNIQRSNRKMGSQPQRSRFRIPSSLLTIKKLQHLRPGRIRKRNLRYPPRLDVRRSPKIQRYPSNDLSRPNTLPKGWGKGTPLL